METELEKAMKECAELSEIREALLQALISGDLTVRWSDGKETTYLAREGLYEVFGVAAFKLFNAKLRKSRALREVARNLADHDDFARECFDRFQSSLLGLGTPQDNAGTSHLGITDSIYSSRFPNHITEFELVPVGNAAENAGGGSPKIDPEGGLGKTETAPYDTDWMKITEEDVCCFRIPGMKTMANTGTIEGTELGWKVTVDDFEFLAEVELPVKATLKKVSSTVGDENFVTAIYLETPSGERIQILDEPHSEIEQEFHDAFSEHLTRFMEAPEFNAAFHLWKEKAACFERGRQFQRMVA
jgi:hypothetical protein